jgi:hypothetical protein
MQSFPTRCQHIKVNGTLCGSPALRRNRFCYFHKRHHEERVELNTDRARQRRKVSLALPVLEDANSIQVSLMQIMRLLVAGQIDSKTAGLLLYALQTASANLGRVTFAPHRHDVVLDPATVGEIPLGARIWSDSDFPTEQDEEDDEGARRIAAVEEGRRIAKEREQGRRWAEAEAARIAEEGERQREQAREAAARRAAELRKLEAQDAARAAARAAAKNAPSAAKNTLPTAAITPTGRAVVPPPPAQPPGKRPPANVNMSDVSDVRKQIRDQVVESLPELAATFLGKQNEGSSG